MMMDDDDDDDDNNKDEKTRNKDMSSMLCTICDLLFPN